MSVLGKRTIVNRHILGLACYQPPSTTSSLNRKLYMVGQTRIHIDTVQGLGHFMELEVVLNPDQSVEEGRSIAKDLQTKLGVQDGDLIDCAYVDLLDRQ